LHSPAGAGLWVGTRGANNANLLDWTSQSSIWPDNDYPIDALDSHGRAPIDGLDSAGRAPSTHRVRPDEPPGRVRIFDRFPRRVLCFFGGEAPLVSEPEAFTGDATDTRTH
jgi:hypothetical protein